MESEAIKFDEYLANNLEKRFEFLYENYSIMKILNRPYLDPITFLPCSLLFELLACIYNNGLH